MSLLDPGISMALAVDRPARVADVRYALQLTLPTDTAVPIAGDARIHFTLHDTSSPLILDFAPNQRGSLHSCEVNGTAIAPDLVNGHLVLPSQALRPGRNAVALRFLAGDAPLNRRDGYLYTIFVPARAHEAFPCFDQPDIKARWTLTLELPSHWRAISNGAATATSPPENATGDPRGSSTRSRVSFAETEPLPTYLFAFAAGTFEAHQAARGDRQIGVYHRATDRNLLDANVDAIVDAHVAALDWLEAYTSIPYPFGKFDIVLLPDFQFGGMEHAGAIFYNQSALLLSASATRNQQLARASVIAHETAHMWFGDLVTMRWFDDVWMKEVCANFMASKIVNPQFADLDHELRFLHAHYPAAYDVDRTRGANPIRQPLDNLDEAASLYGAIVYLKSPIVLRQLELLIGEGTLRAALGEYLSTFAFASASWADLLPILSRHSAIDLACWSRDWIDEAGRPRIDVRVRVSSGGVAISLDTHDPIEGRGLTWPQRVDVAIGIDATVEHVQVWLDGTAGPFERRGPRQPDYILPAGRGLAYGEFHLDDHSLEWLLQYLTEVPDDLTRGSAWLVLWDAMLEGTATPGALLDVALRSVAAERSELNLQRVLSDLQRLFWVFQSPDQRATYASTLESVLRDALERAPTATMKAAVFGTFRAVATTPPALEWLEAVWSGEAPIAGLPLGEADHIELAKELAIRSSATISHSVIERQCARTDDVDRRAALAFLAGALSDDDNERRRFFAAISRAENRRREPWVIEGARWLHHPLRADRAVALIRPGLELLEELKRTGDIFLPKRWVDAMLGGHRSVAAADAVREFVADRRPEYPAALRRIILASADHLFRIARPYDLPI